MQFDTDWPPKPSLLLWSASWCSGSHRCCGACVVPPPLRPLSFRYRFRSRPEILSDRRYEYETGDDTGQKPQSVAYRVLQRAIAPSQHRHSGNGSSHLDQSDSTDDQCDPVGAPRDDLGGISRNLTYCFLRLANLDNGVFERLGRYEAALWRHMLQTLFALQTVRNR
jgi:hypothetical protein